MNAMKIHSAFATTEKGREQITPELIQTEKGGLTAVRLKFESELPLDKFSGIELLLEPCRADGFTAIYRHSEFWCRPAFCQSAQQIPPDTQCLLWQGGCLLPVCGDKYLCMVSGTPDGYIKLTLNTFCSGIRECDTTAFVLGEGENVHALIADCARLALEVMNSDTPLRESRRYPEIFEYLGWCSWDAFHIEVSEQKLLQKCDEFSEKNIPVRWAIIDDMWADTPGIEQAAGKERGEMMRIMHSCRLSSFKADKTRFPDGLDGCIEKLHARGLYVGMWHPTTGYWSGIAEDGQIARDMPQALIKTRRYSAKRAEYSESEQLVHAPDYESARTFYESFHSYLKDCGADFIKVDNQSFTHSFYHDVMPVGQAAENLHRAVDGSAEKFFDGALINCMGTSAENMWHRPQSCVSRCSDDFLPENRDWFTKHILQCSFNSMVQGVFHVCDWDMWWTDDTQAVKNSVLRAVSGGPIYVSDTLGRSRREILMPLCLEDGRILRCDKPAVPLLKCVFQNPESCKAPFMLQSTANGCAYVAAFNLDGENAAVCSDFSPRDIDGLCGDSFVLYEYFTNSATTVKADEKITVALADRDEFRLYALIPEKEITFLGLCGKMIAAKTLSDITPDSAVSAQGGELMFFSQKEVTAVYSDGKPAEFTKDGALYKASAGRGKITVCTEE